MIWILGIAFVYVVICAVVVDARNDALEEENERLLDRIHELEADHAKAD